MAGARVVWLGARGAPPSVLVEVGGLRLLFGSVPGGGAVDPSSLRAVFLSSHECFSTLHWLATPRFAGQVVATEGAAQFARALLGLARAESVDADARPAGAGAESAKRPRVCGVDAVLEHVRTVSVGEIVPLATSGSEVRVRAVHSGYAIGAVNWVVSFAGERLAVLCQSSASVNRHPSSLDLAALRGCRALVLADTSPGEHCGVAVQSALRQLCADVEAVIRRGGNVLLPCWPAGTTLDLIDHVLSHLQRSRIGVPALFAAVGARACLSYASVASETLCAGKQDAALDARHPFLFDEYLRNGSLQVADADELTAAAADSAALHAMLQREPRVLFCAAPSLVDGPIAHFLMRWSASPRSRVILTHPSMQSAALAAEARRVLGLVLVPCKAQPSPEEEAHIAQQIQRLAASGGAPLRCVDLPVDAGLSSSDLRQLVEAARPAALLVPAPLAEALSRRWAAPPSAPLRVLAPLEPLDVPSARATPQLLSAAAAPEALRSAEALTSELALSAAAGTKRLVHVVARLEVAEGELTLRALRDAQQQQPQPPRAALGVDSLAKRLRALGLAVEAAAPNALRLPELGGATVTVEQGRVSVRSGDVHVRALLRRAAAAELLGL
jgi:Cft2 family RNA processing exonuclease